MSSRLGTAGRRPNLHVRSVCMLMMFMVLIVGAAGQTFQVLSSNAGISSMHTAITPIYSTAILLDRTYVGPSKISLTNGTCLNDPNDWVSPHDCTAHSVMLTPGANASSTTLRPLMILTNTWCSAGQFLPNGTMLQVGGDNDGLYKIRRLDPCPSSGTCDWVEDSNYNLTDPRWYATTTLLSDGRVIAVGGRSVSSYEFIPRAAGEGSFFLQLLGEDNLYPFVHLLPDGTLYIFAGRDSVQLDYNTNKVLRFYPSIPGEPRNYPYAGSSVLLPLQYNDTDQWRSSAEVMVCGGAQPGNISLQLEASQTCGRIQPLSASASWVMETMPIRRCMGDMVLLPTREVLIINGAQNGMQTWEAASNPALNPVVYSPDSPSGAKRFVVHPPSEIPRLYHSTANLLPDGRILIAGSNTHQFDTFNGTFPTELRVEAWTPPYMSPDRDTQRPYIMSAPFTFKFGEAFMVTIRCKQAPASVEMNLVSSPFNTHSFSQGQRLVRMSVRQARTANQLYDILVIAPPDANVAPPGFYMMFPIQSSIAGPAVWVHILP